MINKSTKVFLVVLVSVSIVVLLNKISLRMQSFSNLSTKTSLRMQSFSNLLTKTSETKADSYVYAKNATSVAAKDATSVVLTDIPSKNPSKLPTSPPSVPPQKIIKTFTYGNEGWSGWTAPGPFNTILNYRTTKYEFVEVSRVEEADMINLHWSPSGILDKEVVNKVNQVLNNNHDALIVMWSGENIPGTNSSFWEVNLKNLGLSKLDVALGFTHKENVDLTRSYVKDYARLPSTFMYYDMFDFKKCFLKDHIANYMESDIYEDWQNRPNNVALFSGHLKYPRDELYHLMVGRFGEIDSYGKAHHNRDGNVDKLLALPSFKFVITPENSEGDGYVTEKLYQAFAAGAVPLYWQHHPDSYIFNEDRMLIYEENKVQELMENINRLVTDDDFARDFFQRPVLKPGARTYAQSLCDDYTKTIVNALDRKLVKDS